MATSYLTEILTSEFSEKFIADKSLSALSFFQTLSIDNILEYDTFGISSNLKSYIYMALLYRIDCMPNPKWSEIKPFLEKTSPFLTINSLNQKKFAQIFDSILSKASRNIVSLKETLEMSVYIKTISSTLLESSSPGIIFLATYQGLLKLSLECLKTPSVKIYKKLIKTLQKLVEQEINVENYAKNIVFDTLCFLRMQYSLDTYKKNTQKDPERSWKIIMILERPEMTKFYNQECLEFICSKLENVMKRHEAKRKFSIFNIIDNTQDGKKKLSYELDEKDIKIVGACLSTKKGNGFISNIFKGQWNGRNVCLKIYQEFMPDSDMGKVEEEIKIYAKLSSLRDQNSCFLEYFGTCFSQDENNLRKIVLVMQWVDKNLKDFINSLIITSTELNENEIKSIFISLLNSFSFLHEIDIFHLDIKPENILKDDNSLYIIDFDVAVLDRDHSTLVTRTESGNYVGTWGYADPDIQAAIESGERLGYSKSRADVFSLGMTFYHILAKDKFMYELNKVENKEKLENGINGLSYGWAKDLLRQMLEFDRTKRISMAVAKNMINSSQTFQFVIED